MSDDTTNDTTNDTVVGQLARTLARTMTEVIKLRRWKEEAETVILGLQELGQTLGVPLGANVTGKTATDAAAALVAERDQLRAQVAAVRALADEWRYRPHPEGAESVSDWTYRMHEQSLGSLLGLALDTAGGERP